MGKDAVVTMVVFFLLNDTIPTQGKSPAQIKDHLEQLMCFELSLEQVNVALKAHKTVKIWVANHTIKATKVTESVSSMISSFK